MKTLYLIRHAKSSWNNNDLTDFDRPLNARGKYDATNMGERLLKQKVMHGCIISSSAKRTKKTAKRITKALKFNYRQIDFREELYHSNYMTLMNCITNISDVNDSAFIIAHNPGISNFCDYLTHQALCFPTCGIAKITFEVDSWYEITSNSGTLDWFDYPKKKN
jgi:phosphohistidine phosphatase